jgi:prepilin-type N-terminal cleavage/methylation domain-containing protein
MKKGFTIIEMIVVVAVIGFMMPLFVSIFFNISRLQMQLMVIQELKEQGDYVRSQIINTVRNNATIVNGSCAGLTLPNTDQTELCFYDKNSVAFAFTVDSSANVASYSAALAAPITLLSVNANNDITVRIISPSFTAIDTKTAQFKYTVSYTPKVNYLPQQSLSYQFYTYLRN